MRLFVAVWPDGATVEALAELLLPPEPTPGVRWITVSDWHVTLSFLGSVPDEECEGLVQALASAAAACRPATARAGPATQLLGRAVLCLPVEGLDEIAEAVLAATAAFSRSPEPDRAFFGHLTLARAAGRRALPREVAGAPASAQWPVDTFRLVRSTTGPQGSIYETQAVFALGGPGPSQDEHVFGYTVRDDRLPDTPPP